MLGALVQHALDEREAAAVTSHLDHCPSCRQVVIAAVRAGIALTPPTLAVGTPTVDPATGKPLAIAPEGSGPAGPSPGSSVGRYQVRALIGAGGMGRVYEAFDPELDRAIALKLMRPELGKHTAILAERLIRESRLMAKVAHPSVIAVHDVGRVGDSVFIAMDLIRGETLGAYVRRVRPPWREVVALLERAGQGLAAAHATGIVHRDFKPDNILVELDGTRVVVTDFGVARAFADRKDRQEAGPPRPDASGVELTATGTAIGTPAYMAPEQLDGRSVDHRADVFAFAVTAWELLFGDRPFAGRTAGEIRTAIDQPPRRAPGRRVPGRVIRVLERGLAGDLAVRWPDMDTFLRALARATRRTRVAIFAAAGAGLVGIGIVAARLLAAPPADPCAPGLAALDSVYGDAEGLMMAATLAGDPKLRGDVLARLDKTVDAWRATHRATCRAGADPIQPAMTSACLDARRLELAGFVDDVLADGETALRYARSLSGLLGDPSRCATPASGLVAARVPVDPELRARVTKLRYRAFDAERARDRGQFQAAIDGAKQVVAEAASVWPPLQAEAMYLLGTTHSYGGDNVQAIATLRDAAALAERVHHDYIAANSWIQLGQSASFDAGDPQRALEYLTYADAAVDRIGRPSDTVTLLEYVRGASLIEADRSKEGEVAMRKALALAETSSPWLLPQVIQGLGYLYEDQGRFPEAIAAYRKALAKMAEAGPIVPATEAVFRERLATSLNFAGQLDEALVEARKSVEIADRVMADNNLDRAVAHLCLAQVLQHQGKYAEALAEAEPNLAAVVRIVGDRNERYGESLRLVAGILLDLDRKDEAAKKLARACDIIAFGTGEGSSPQAECWLDEASALAALDRHVEALALVEKALPILVKTLGETHPQVANAYVNRGALKAELGRPDGIPDLERAVALFGDRVLDAGHLAAAKWALGKNIAKTDRERGTALVEEAVAKFASAGPSWHRTRDEATAWLASRRGKR